jgi:ParB/RepB/Spo0J family partition protein
VTKRRKTTNISDILFEDVNPYGAVIGEAAPQTAERIPLSAIRPDPDQPRRLLPTDLAQALTEGRLDPPDAMRQWLSRAADPATAQELRELKRLATAIEQHGLINPITIRPAEDAEEQYTIVTGERRYWAHVLLQVEARRIQEGDATLEPDQIKASLASPGVSIRAHQIVENLMREEINVVEKARGLLALRRELSESANTPAEAAEEPTQSASDQPGSPQTRLVAWKRVEDALDMSRQYRARIVAVLDLSEAALALVDRHNLSERTIRPVVEKLKPYPDLQLQALRQLVAWQEAEEVGQGAGRRIVPSIEALVDTLLAARQAPAGGRGRGPARGLDFARFRQKVRGTLNYLQKLDEPALTEFSRILENEAGGDILDELHALRDRIDGMLAALTAEKEASDE